MPTLRPLQPMNPEDTERHRKECLRRHYENMPLDKAKRLKSKFSNNGSPTEMQRKFIKRINAAKGYKAL